MGEMPVPYIQTVDGDVTITAVNDSDEAAHHTAELTLTMAVSYASVFDCAHPLVCLWSAGEGMVP